MPIFHLSAKDLIENSNKVFLELIHAGASIFQKSKRNGDSTPAGQPQVQASKFKVVTRLGWNSGAFVLPEEIIGRARHTLEPSFRHLDQQLLAKYRIKGTLQAWQSKIGRLCFRQFPAHVLRQPGIYRTYLRLVHPPIGGFQLLGGRIRQDAAAMVTGSIWGCHRLPERREIGFAERWHTTASKIEITALAHNETVLPLDETKRAGRQRQGTRQAVLDISFGLSRER